MVQKSTVAKKEGWLDVAERQPALALGLEAFAQRCRLLAQACGMVFSSLDYSSTLSNVARMALPHFADWALVEILEEGQLKTAAAAHCDPCRVALLDALQHLPARRVESAGLAGRVCRSARSELMVHVDAVALQAFADEVSRYELMRRLESTSILAVPLLLPENILGVLVLVRTHADNLFSHEDVGFAEELAQRAGLALQHAVKHRRLKQADRQKNEFLATLAHELRNPLAPICHAMQIIRMIGTHDPSLLRAREIVERQAAHMSRLINDLLDVSRIQCGKLELRKVRLDFCRVILDAVESVMPGVRARGQELSLSLPDQPLTLAGDPLRLEQAVVNLLGNASKYTPLSGRIEVVARMEQDCVRLTISDTGIGIAPEMLTKVFDLFTQADQSSDSSQGGLGIGLALVRYFIEAHGGSVKAQSPGLEKGSEFTVLLPLGAAAADPTCDSQIIRPLFPADGRLRRVLIIEDNDDCRESLKLVLSSWGHAIELASNGPEGLERAVAMRPDLALVDLGLPGLDGFEVARRVRAVLGPTVVLVALTGYGQPQDRRRALDAGFNHHLIKPASLEDLIRVVGGPVVRKPQA